MSHTSIIKASTSLGTRLHVLLSLLLYLSVYLSIHTIYLSLSFISLFSLFFIFLTILLCLWWQGQWIKKNLFFFFCLLLLTLQIMGEKEKRDTKQDRSAGSIKCAIVFVFSCLKFISHGAVAGDIYCSPTRL